MGIIYTAVLAKSNAVEGSAIACMSLQRGRYQVFRALTGLTIQQDLSQEHFRTASRLENLVSWSRQANALALLFKEGVE